MPAKLSRRPKSGSGHLADVGVLASVCAISSHSAQLGF
jgi:hypothetical protein